MTRPVPTRPVAATTFPTPTPPRPTLKPLAPAGPPAGYEEGWDAIEGILPDGWEMRPEHDEGDGVSERVDIVDRQGRVRLGLVYCHEPNAFNGAESVGWRYCDADGCWTERLGGGPLTVADLRQERSAWRGAQSTIHTSIDKAALAAATPEEQEAVARLMARNSRLGGLL